MMDGDYTPGKGADSGLSPEDVQAAMDEVRFGYGNSAIEVGPDGVEAVREQNLGGLALSSSEE